MRRSIIVAFAVAFFLASTVRSDEPTRKAIAFLSTEVPAWSRDHHCFSCHNNGDAARALYHAKVNAPGVLTETTRWLTRPEAWDGQGVEGPSSDKRLARLQFALALATAIETGASNARVALNKAADRVADDLGTDGSWPADDRGMVGSPVTYGKRLATALAVRVLRSDGATRHAKLIEKAENWLRSQPIENIDEAAATLMIEPIGREISTMAGGRALDFLLRAQAKRGGWGPYPEVPTEPFDTALALIAVQPFRSRHDVATAIVRGRTALILMQRPDGSWPATTRPSGGESYAQTLSTTGWAAMALLED